MSQERAGDLFAAAREGDSDAQRLVHRVAYHLGQGLINIIAFCAPDVLVLGGGVMRHFDLLEPGTRAALAAVAQYQPIDRVQLQRSQLGDHAGILGAVYLMRRAAENQANG